MAEDLHGEFCATPGTTFCLFPLHPGPCRRARSRQRAAQQQQQSTQVSRSVPLRRTVLMQGGGDNNRPPAKKAGGTVYGTPAAQRKAQGRATVGAPPAKSTPAKKAGGTVYGTPAKKAAKKAPAKKAAPVKATAPPRSRGPAADAGNAAQMLLSGSRSVNSQRYVQTLMQHVASARQADANRGDGNHDEYNKIVTRAALEISRVLAQEAGASGDERRRLGNRIAQVANDAMRTGDTRGIRSIHDELAAMRRTRTASASPAAYAARFGLSWPPSREERALALFGLQMVHPSMYGLPAFPLGPLHSLAHLECNLSVFCRNPLHPGPCKGWKGTLAKVAPGALALIEAERKKKLAAKQKKIAAAKAAASKIVDQAKRGVEVDEHPNAKKKLAKKSVAQILGDDETKIADIEGKTKLSQKEIAWHAGKRADALVAANVAAGNLKSKLARQKYRQYARAQIIAALKADNESGATGEDSEYAKTVASLSSAIAVSHAGKHVVGDTDESANLHAAVADAFGDAIQADVKNLVAGKPAVNMKKLDKALSDIPGEPGDPDHDVAVGEAVGHSYTPPAGPDPAEVEAAEQAKKAKIKAAGDTGRTLAGLGGNMLDPEMIAGAFEAAATEHENLMDSPQVQQILKGIAAAGAMRLAVNTPDAASYNAAKKLLGAKLEAEIAAHVEEGHDKPAEGTLLALLDDMNANESPVAPLDAIEKALGEEIPGAKPKLTGTAKAKAAMAAKAAPAAKAGADGGAGAGGGTTAKNQASALDDIHELIHDDPSGAAGDVYLHNVEDAGMDPDEIAGSTAAGLATGLIDQVAGKNFLTDEQKAALHEVAAHVIKSGIKGGNSTMAKQMVKNLKTISGPELTKIANQAIAKKKAHEAQQAKAGPQEVSPSVVPPPAKKAGSVSDFIKAQKASQAAAKKTAPPAAEPDALDSTPTPLDEPTEAEIADFLAPLNTPSVTPMAGPGAPLAAAPTPQDAALKIGSMLEQAHAKLLPGVDGSKLTSPAYVEALAKQIEAGATPEEKAHAAAKLLAKAWLQNKLSGYSTPLNLLHEAALQDAIAAEIEEGILTGKLPTGGWLDKVGKPNYGIVKLKIAAKKAWTEAPPLGTGPKKSTTPLFPTKSTKDAALDDALDEAFGAADPTGPPPTVKKNIWIAANNDASASSSQAAKSVVAKYEAEMAAATTPEEKTKAIDKAAAALAGVALGSAFNELGLGLGEFQAADVAKWAQALKADFKEAIEGDADVVGGGAAALAHTIVAEVNKKAKQVQTTNLFPDSSPALVEYKKALFHAQMEQAVGSTTPPVTTPGGGAGAGGTGTGINPAVPAATTPAPPPVAPAKKAAKKAAPTKALPKVKKPVLKNMTKVGGQQGSNPGGTYEDASGTRHYVKQQKSKAHAQNEAAAAALYRAAGINVPAVHVGTGAPGLKGTQTSSELVPGATPLSAANLDEHRAAIRRGFAVDAWLGNWDVAGLTMDNIVIGDDGQPHRIDVGGSLAYRAQGTPKGDAFGDDVREFDTLRDPSQNPQSAKLFAGMTDAELIESLEQVEAVTPEQIQQIGVANGQSDEMIKKLIKRREALMKRLSELRAQQLAALPESGQTPEQVKLAGTKKKQKIIKPQGIYPISQVVVEGNEADVAAYNARVNAGVQGKEALNVPRQMSSITGNGRQALKWYSGAGSGSINGHLRAGGGPSGSPSSAGPYQGAGANVAALDKEFEKSRLPQATTTLRGFTGSAQILGALWTERRDQNWAGAEFQDLGYGSSSVQMSTARGFAGAPGPNSVILRIHMPKGTRAIGLGKSSSVSGEGEVLLNRGARFRIVADNGYQNGARHLDVEVICESDDCE